METRHLDWHLSRGSMLVVGGLTIAQLVAAIGQLTLAILAGIIGVELAPTAALATLPITIKILGVATAAYPVSRLIRRFGRRRVFLGTLAWAACGSLIAAWGIEADNFAGFCIGCYMIGNNMASVAQFRFVAASNVPPSMVSRAVAFVMLGMLGSAFLAPWVSIEFRDLLATPYSGIFVVMPITYLLAALIIGFLPMQEPGLEKSGSHLHTPIKTVLARRDIQLAILTVAIGNGVMSFIMTATPISMHIGDGHTVEQTAEVIRDHILGMFIPSLFSGWLIAKLGIRSMLWAGLALQITCVLIAISGQTYWQYWLAMVSLGVGWNLLFLSGTTLLTTACPAESEVRVQGINETIMFGSMAVCSLSAGALLDQFGWITTNLCALLLLSFILFGILRNQHIADPQAAA